METIEQLLGKLNGPQREAVLENTKPLLVLAGAGSGKTRVITTKIAYAIRELGLPSWQVLAVTFTNKAANEMKERVAAMVGDDKQNQGSTIKTFHGFGAMVLRRFPEKAGLSPNFTIYDDSDSYDLLKRCAPEFDAKVLRSYARKISLCKDRGVTDAMLKNSPDQIFRELYQKYQRALDATGNVDFADLILKLDRLLDDDEVASWTHRRYAMILVDEYQDTNMSQFCVLKKLVGPSTFIGVVGDDDQSIYKFRGAEEGIISSFVKTFKDVQTIKLEQNYRSTSSILSVANSVIRNNHKGGDMKKLWTDLGTGTKPEYYSVPDETEEAKLVARLIKKQGDYDNTAVLFRTNAQSGAFENVFTAPQFKIPYKVVGALKFYDREQVKDGLSMMYLLCNPRDVVSFRRMVNKPARGIGRTAMETIEASITEHDGDCLEGLRAAKLTSKAKEGAGAFLDVLDECGKLVDEGNLTDALEKLFRDSHLIQLYKDQDQKDGKEVGGDGSRVADFDTLVTQASQYGEDRKALCGFLETLALDSTTIGYIDPRDKPGVTLITMHNTKGLEYDHVFVVGLEEGLFPSAMSLEEDSQCSEERRLFYVAVTRAKKTLVMTSAKMRRMYGDVRFNPPSRFIQEIGDGLINTKEIFRDNSFADSGYHGLSAMGERREHRPSTGDGTVPRKSASSSSSALLHKGFGEKSKPFNFTVIHNAPKSGSSIFPAGQRVYSDSYGSGTVLQVKKGDPEVIVVKFDSGRSATFISKYARLEKIAD